MVFLVLLFIKLISLLLSPGFPPIEPDPKLQFVIN
jgi:hypothetical protein